MFCVFAESPLKVKKVLYDCKKIVLKARAKKDIHLGDGKIGDSYSLEVATTAHVTPFFLTFFGCHHCFAFYLSHTPMSRVSKNTHLIDSLSETTRFANSNLLNITNALRTS